MQSPAGDNLNSPSNDSLSGRSDMSGDSEFDPEKSIIRVGENNKKSSETSLIEIQKKKKVQTNFEEKSYSLPMYNIPPRVVFMKPWQFMYTPCWVQPSALHYQPSKRISQLSRSHNRVMRVVPQPTIHNKLQVRMSTSKGTQDMREED